MAGTSLIIGASGMVGLALYREAVARGLDVTGTFHRAASDLPFRRLDLTDGDAVAGLLRELRPGTVLVPAAEPNVDACERDPVAARAINVAPWPQLVALARELDFLPVFYSTDYVFDGQHGPYPEDAAVRPINLYGEMKLEVEHVLAAADVPFLVIRTANVFGPELRPKNYALRTAATLGEGKRIKAAHDMFGTPTFAPALARDTWDLLDAGARGVFHLAGADYLDRHAYAREIAIAFGHDPELVDRVSAAELGLAASRPLRAGLTCERAESLLGRPMEPLAQGLAGLRALEATP